MREVILFLILCADKFLSTIDLVEDAVKHRRTYVINISKNLWILKARRESPNSIPKRIRKKILRISPRLKDNNARGRK